MEARDSRSKIRPLPIDEIDGDAPRDRRVAPRRKWLPLVVIVIGATAFGVIARGLAPTDSAEVATASTTAAPISETPEPTTTAELPPPPPPTLSKLLPFTDRNLQLTSLDRSAAIGEWAADSTSPAFNARIEQAQSATYNSAGSHVAVHSRVLDGSIIIVPVGDGSPIYLRGDITGGEWHPTDPTLFAWSAFPTGRDVDGDISYLRIADISGYDGIALVPLIEIVLDGGPHTLLAWGDWGFVTTDLGRAFSPVTVFDSDGQSPLELEGAFYDASSDGTLLMARVDDAGNMPYLLETDRTETELAGLDLGGIDFRITSDGEWVLALTPQADGHTSILARTVRSRFARLTSIDEPARIISLTSDDRYLILQETSTSDLIFKDWNTRAEYRIPMDEQIAAAFL